MDIQSMSNVRGGEWDVTLKDSSVKFTNKKHAIAEDVNITIEVEA